MSAKKPPSESVKTATISLPAWVWERIDAECELGSTTAGRSATIKKIILASLEAKKIKKGSRSKKQIFPQNNLNSQHHVLAVTPQEEPLKKKEASSG